MPRASSREEGAVPGSDPVRAAVRRTDDVAILELGGDLDVSSVAVVERSLSELEAEAPPRLVIDLRGLTFLDSSGLRMIVAADARARRDGRDLVLIRGPESVARVFRTTLLEWRLRMVDDPSEVPGWGDDRV
ncbi:MAG TPA: STAS domain-containing protein [Actinomycetota bacterium]|nr:STAS domain-containing protein [Actinomycetota bacterium]